MMMLPTLILAAAIAAQEPTSDVESARARELLAARDARPELLYNSGVARYRAGELELARELFAAAAAKAKAQVAARAMYNRGTTSYAEAARGLPGGGDAPAAKPDETMASLERALRELKDAIRADPTNADARANAELAHRVLKELRQQQQQQQQEQQQKDTPKEENRPPDESQKGDNQPQPEQKQDGKDEDSREPSEQQREQESGEGKDGEEQPSAERDPRKPMTKEDVERLLQKIRDKERARLLDKILRERARTQPAPKDW